MSPCNYFVVSLSQSIHFLWCEHLAWVFNRSLAGHFDLSPDKLLGSLRKHAIVLPMCAAQGGLKGQMETNWGSWVEWKEYIPCPNSGEGQQQGKFLLSQSLLDFLTFLPFAPFLHNFYCTADYYSSESLGMFRYNPLLEQDDWKTSHLKICPRLRTVAWSSWWI